jgi:ABC-type multidrug transport system permease subunit
MVNTDPVKIVVEIVDKFSDELNELRQELERIDQKDIDPDFDLDDNGDIESIRAQLEALRQHIEAEIDIDLDDVAQTEAKLDALARDRTVNIDTDGDILSTEQIQGIRDISNQTIEDLADENLFARSFDTDTRGVPQISGGPADEFLENINRQTEGFRDLHGSSLPLMDPNNMAGSTPDRLGMALDVGRGSAFEPGGVLGERVGTVGPDFSGFDSMDFDFGGSGGIFQEIDPMEAFTEFAEENKSTLRKLIQRFDNLRPSMRTWMNMVAAAIPLIITLGGAVVGLVGALGALATAGGAVVGLGLLGWGDSLESSMKNAQREAQKLKQQLFGVIQPAANVFQPILEDWMQGAPHQVERLVDPFQRLTVFEDELAAIGVGFVDWIAEGVRAMAELDDMIGSIAKNFGQAIGGFIIEALSKMVRDLYRNQDAYMRLGAILVDLVVILFNVSKTISFVIAQFGFVFDILMALSNFLTNKFVVGILTVISTFLLMEAAIGAIVAGLGALFGLMTGGTIASAFGTILTYVGAAIWKFTMLAYAIGGVKAALAGLALGALGAIAVGGFALHQGSKAIQRMSGPSGGGSTSVDNSITIEGSVGQREMDRLRDMSGREARKEMDFAGGI